MFVRNRPSLSITLPKSIFHWVDREAERTNRSRSQMIAAIIQAEMDRSTGTSAAAKTENFGVYTGVAARPLASPMDYIISLARNGVRSLGLPTGKSPESIRDMLREKQPTLLQIIRDVAASAPVDPSSMQLFNERFWPFPLNELEGLRSVYSLVWQDVHA